MAKSLVNAFVRSRHVYESGYERVFVPECLCIRLPSYPWQHAPTYPAPAHQPYRTPRPLLHHPMCSPHSPASKRLPAVGLVPYLDTLTITKEQHSMITHHIAATDSMNSDLISPFSHPPTAPPSALSLPPQPVRAAWWQPALWIHASFKPQINADEHRYCS